MFKHLIVFAVAVLMPISAFALTIDETIQLALASNNNLKSKEYTLKSKELASNNAMLIFFPSIGAQYDFSYTWRDMTNALQRKTESNVATFSTYVNLNLFNGLSDMFNFQIAKLDSKMAASDLDAAGYDTILEAQNAYINLLKAKSDLEVAESNLKLLEMQKRDAQISADNGLIARNDLLQTEAYLASAQLQKITAQSAVTQAVQKLEKVINRKLDPNEELIEPVLLDITLESEEVLKEKMFNNRSDLKYLEQSYEVAKKNELTALSGVYPKVDASFTYTTYGNDGNPFTGAPKSDGNVNSFVSGGNTIDNNMAVGITASWDLLNVASSSMQSIANKRTRQALAYSIADTKQNMLLELQTYIEMYYTSKAQLAQALTGIKHAEENYRVRKNLYDQSAATMTELLDASSILNEAKVAESNARYSVISSVYQLERTIQEKLPVHTNQAQ